MIGSIFIAFVISPVVKYLTGYSPLYWIYYYITYTYLWYCEKTRRSRFDLYDFFAEDDPEKQNFFVPHQEWELETPKQRPPSQENTQSDDVFCFGVNRKHESLAVHLSRLPGKQVRCSLILRLSDGKSFTLPEQHIIQKENSDPHVFGSSRLKIECILPLRKWRIFFNGVLRELQETDAEGKPSYKHVRFTFLWTAASDVFDFTWNTSKKDLANGVARSSTFGQSPVSSANSIRKIFDSYEHPGMLLGTLTVDGEEEREIYMWGVRGRYMGNTRSLKNSEFLEYYGNFENGTIMHLGKLKCDALADFTFGYVMRPDGYIFPVERCTEIESLNHTVFKFTSHGWKYKFSVEKDVDTSIAFSKEFGGETSAGLLEMSIDNSKASEKGWGFIFKGKQALKKMEKQSGLISAEEIEYMNVENILSISFEHVACQKSSLTGGKGSSLGKLCALAKRFDSGDMQNSASVFEVPSGIVVTTEAYKEFIKGDLEIMLQDFEMAVWKSTGSITELCEKAAEKVRNANLPDSIKSSVSKNLINLFGSSAATVRFAVRSSAAGEDTEQMSAAGQMETFLGVVGFEEVFKALKNCWASQFSFQAVEYKRRYGQLLNSPMAVVIQQMVPCEAAGVIFTCDPVTGSPEYISITANWGLGESVVSAAADPDTFLLKRGIDNKLQIHSKNLGKKSTKIIMDENHGTAEVKTADESEKSCLSDDALLKLGEIAVQIEEYYGNPRDLEWGIIGDKVFLLQSRPVTSIDIETDFEIRHFFDTYMRTDEEYYTKANVGEVMPGAASSLGIDVLGKCFYATGKRTLFMKWDPENIPYVPYYERLFVFNKYHAFFNMLDGFMTMPEESVSMKNSFMVSLFGKIIDDSEMSPRARQRHLIYTDKGKSPIAMQFFTLIAMFFGGMTARRRGKQVEKFNIPFRGKKTSMELLHTIGCGYHILAEGLKGNTDCIMSSSFWNLFVLELLAKAGGGYRNNVLSDFAFLLSSSKKVESADVPSSLEKLACTIAGCIEPETFKKMNQEEALKWLESSKSKARIQFESFLEKHGHRCVKEFDVHSQPWGSNPKTLVKLLQNMVSSSIKSTVDEESMSFSYILSHMQVKLSFIQKVLLFILLPNCRRGVRDREAAKSVLIKSVDKVRQPFRPLAQLMVEEGRLPDKEMMYFLTVEEIKQLILTRSPRIVTRAARRLKLHAELDKLIFPEITCGVPEPINLCEKYVPTGNEFSMTGTPVSQGITRGPARVVLHLEEASTIQQGDILITYATDIGWSPYFPLLSGVVTELGGLISHGAVVAREYGLPCVVGLHGATRAFKSGDIVVLDGTKGILQKEKTEE